MEQEPEEHDVRFDYGGSRLTCRSCPEDRTTTCLRQSYTQDAQWQEMLAAFKRKHPFTEAKPW